MTTLPPPPPPPPPPPQELLGASTGPGTLPPPGAAQTPTTVGRLVALGATSLVVTVGGLAVGTVGYDLGVSAVQSGAGTTASRLLAAGSIGAALTAGAVWVLGYGWMVRRWFPRGQRIAVVVLAMWVAVFATRQFYDGTGAEAWPVGSVSVGLTSWLVGGVAVTAVVHIADWRARTAMERSGRD